MKPRIFLSHSTKTDEAAEFLLAVKDALDADYEVKLDRDGLKLGDDWRRTLYAWMDQAHGAVLLLTEAALKSNFVPIEASVLSWRHYRDPDFAFLPVFVDATDFDALKRRPVLRALALDVFQIARVDSDDVPAAITAIRQALGRFQDKFPHPNTPLERLQFFLRNELEQSRIDSFTLEQIGREVFLWPEPAPGNVAAVLSSFAQSLVEAKRDAACEALKRLSDELVVRVARVLEAVAPTWIEMDRAVPIAETVFSEPARRQLLLDTDERLIIDLYICRACCRPYPPLCRVIQITSPTRQDTVGDISDQIVAALLPRRPSFSAPDIGQIKRQLDQYDLRHLPVFLLFPTDFVPDADLIDELRKVFPTLTIFIPTRHVDGDLLAPLRKNATELAALPPEEEQSIVADFDALRGVFSATQPAIHEG
ncbi:MAG: TIR domain-containing protein [Pirellulaceae bacterium]|nr:TIR domain-containing protein [Pirellulaceae bacterium]